MIRVVSPGCVSVKVGGESGDALRVTWMPRKVVSSPSSVSSLSAFKSAMSRSKAEGVLLARIMSSTKMTKRM